MSERNRKIAEHLKALALLIESDSVSQTCAQSLPIPEGWRELKPYEVPEATDMFERLGGWHAKKYVGSSEYKWYGVRHIRKIKTANPSETPNSPKWIPKVGDKVRVNKPSRRVHGKVGVVVKDDSREYAVRIDGEDFTSYSLEAQYLELIAAAPPADHIADADKMVPPTGYRLLDKSAKVEPRKAGDLFWSLTLGDWKILSDEGEQDANRDDWPACRKIETANPPETPDSSIPDPGPGYRLLSKDPPERVVKGDEFFDGCKWLGSGVWVHEGGPQGSFYYRRKIEEPAKEQETQYREPTYADLANGPIEVEVCDNKTNELNWVKRALYAVLPSKCRFRYVVGSSRGDGFTEHYKYARIEVETANSSETSNSSLPFAELVKGLSQAMQRDQDLAWTWHCNIATASCDEGACPSAANLAAARFMRIAFGVDVTTFDQWKSAEWLSSQPLAIPDGWRELEPHDFPRRSDMREVDGSWEYNNTDSDAEYKYWKIRVIRKIEQWPGHVQGVWVEEAEEKLAFTQDELEELIEKRIADRERIKKEKEEADANASRKSEPTEWIPKVGDKVRVVGGLANTVGEVGIIKAFCPVLNGEFLVFTSNERCFLGWFKKNDFELIEAAPR